MRYFIMAPPYRHNSSGIRALYELQKHLIKAGEGAITINVMPYPISGDFVAVYPETVPGNPFGAEKVIRYVLNYPGKLGGDTEYAETEKIITWDKLYYDAPVLQIPSIFEPFFTNRGQDRTTDCFWVGKGKNTGQHPQGCREISYYWPISRKDIADILNMCRTLYTYDDTTALTYEAQLCGCDVRQIKDNNLTRLPIDDTFGKDFENQFNEFLKLYREAA